MIFCTITSFSTIRKCGDLSIGREIEKVEVSESARGHVADLGVAV